MIKRRLRTPTDEECRLVEGRYGIRAGGKLDTMLICTLGPFGLGLAVEWVLEQFAVHVGPFLRYGFLGLGGGLGLIGVVRVSASRRRQRARMLDQVEEVRVEDPVWVKVQDGHFEFPIYILQVAPSTLLYLCGQFLWDSWAHRGPEEERTFPSRAFTLIRDRETGDVLRVDVLGEPVDPVRELPARGFQGLVSESALVEGTLETVQQSIAMQAR